MPEMPTIWKNTLGGHLLTYIEVFKLSFETIDKHTLSKYMGQGS